MRSEGRIEEGEHLRSPRPNHTNNVMSQQDNSGLDQTMNPLFHGGEDGQDQQDHFVASVSEVVTGEDVTIIVTNAG